MRMAKSVGIVGALVLTLGVLACDSECDQSGCLATGKAATEYRIKTGIAGAAADEGDDGDVAESCSECLLSDGKLLLFEATSAITTQEAAQTLIDQAGSMQTVEFSGTYEQALLPGEHLICAELGMARCQGITIADGEVVTVNVRYTFVGPGLTVFLPGESEPSASPVFNVTIPETL